MTMGETLLETITKALMRFSFPYENPQDDLTHRVQPCAIMAECIIEDLAKDWRFVPKVEGSGFSVVSSGCGDGPEASGDDARLLGMLNQISENAALCPLCHAGLKHPHNKGCELKRQIHRLGLIARGKERR